ncbi:hypothetical protein ACWEOI_19835 [Nocardia sp. NPDC004340]
MSRPIATGIQLSRAFWLSPAFSVVMVVLVMTLGRWPSLPNMVTARRAEFHPPA